MIYVKSNTVSNIFLKNILFLFNVTDSFSSAAKGIFRAMSKILDGVFREINKCLKAVNIFVKRYILDAWQGSEYASGNFFYSPKKIFELSQKQEDRYWEFYIFKVRSKMVHRCHGFPQKS